MERNDHVLGAARTGQKAVQVLSGKDDSSPGKQNVTAAFRKLCFAGLIDAPKDLTNKCGELSAAEHCRAVEGFCTYGQSSEGQISAVSARD